MTRRARPSLFAISLLVGIGVVLAAPAGAHTEVSRATPGPGETVDAGVDSVELVFLDPVLPEVDIEVTDLEGRVVAGLDEVEVSADRTVASVRFDPLDEGRFEVRYTFVAEDGDRRDEGYQFSVEEADGGGLSAAVAAAVLGAVLVTLVAVAFGRRGSTTQHGS